MCQSVNDEICHGFPRDEKLKDGTFVKVDMVINLDGGLSDSCWSYVVGGSDQVNHLMKVKQKKPFTEESNRLK